MPRHHKNHDAEAYEDKDEARPRWSGWLIVCVLATLSVGLGFLIPYTIYLNDQVSERFGELRWQIPTRVYARPLVLAPGGHWICRR